MVYSNYSKEQETKEQEALVSHLPLTATSPPPQLHPDQILQTGEGYILFNAQQNSNVFYYNKAFEVFIAWVH